MHNPIHLHIGASRAGSTWLAKHINAHPNSLFPINGMKNTYFWNREYASSVGKRIPCTLEEYCKTYEPDAFHVKSDFTDANSWIPESSIKELAKHFPDARITYCLRNPITTLWSHIVKLKNARRTDRLEHILAKTFFDGKPSRRQPIFYKNIEYYENLLRWFRNFDRDQFFVYQFESVVTQPNLLLKQIASHINLASDFYDAHLATAKVNAGIDVDVRNDFRKYVWSYVKGWVPELEELLDLDFSHWEHGTV